MDFEKNITSLQANLDDVNSQLKELYRIQNQTETDKIDEIKRYDMIARELEQKNEDCVTLEHQFEIYRSQNEELLKMALIDTDQASKDQIAAKDALLVLKERECRERLAAAAEDTQRSL